MNILIKDDQGLDTVLMMDGYSQEQRQEAKQTIRAQFRETAIKVFQEVLDKPLPETILVNMAINDREEMKGEEAARLASYNVELSRAGTCFFTIREITVKTILDHSDIDLFKSTVIHEMFHAADKFMLENNMKLFKRLRNDINDESDNYSTDRKNAPIALLSTLLVFDHYRAEGVAILGESLLMKSKFKATQDAVAQFCSIFKLTMMRSQMRANGRNEKVFNKDTIHVAYNVAPTILLLVLGQTGNVERDLVNRALAGLSSGDYKLDDEEIITIMRSAVNLSLMAYIQGMMGLGDMVAPIRPFLNFCSLLQDDGDEDNMEAFEQLIQKDNSAEVFHATMDQIMGCCMPESELDPHYSNFMRNTPDNPLYPKFKEKVSLLYDVLKNDTDPEKKRLAQWALTYLFDDEDLIHDDVSGLGLVDDMTVIDYAIRLIQAS